MAPILHISEIRASGSPVYLALMMLGLAIGTVYWARASRADARLALVFFGGLAGAFGGAKLAYLVSEGWLFWHHPDRWQIWLAGKSVMGALPGGWLGVEIAKIATGYRSSTGDRFALLLPLPLLLGRIGCLHAGCCGGIGIGTRHWPAVETEMAFQVLALATMWWMRRARIMQDRRFFLYLIAYGVFRFAHEFLRATPKPFCGLSGYQWIALATAAAATWACLRRTRQTAASTVQPGRR